MQGIVSIFIGNAAVATAIAVVAFVAMRLGRPAVAHVLWLLVIVKLLTPPVWRVAVTEEAPARAADAPVVQVAGAGPNPVTAEAAGPPERTTPVSSPPPVSDDAAIAAPPTAAPAPVAVTAARSICIPCILAWLWLAGSVAWIALSARRVVRFRRLLRDGRPADADLADEVAALAGRLELPRVPDVRMLDASVSPMLWFLGRRVTLVLPAPLVTNMPPPQRQGVIAHELAHLKRRDHWVRLLEIVATAVLWWHPLLWLARRGLREAEEQCCDAWVVALLPDDRRRYADALVDTLEFVAGRSAALPAGATGLGRIGHLRRRLTMILTQTPPKSLSWTGRLAVAALAVALLPLVPVRGQAAATAPADAAAPSAPPATTQKAAEKDETYRTVEALLTAASQDADADVKNASANSIIQFGPRAVPALLDAVKNPATAAAARYLLANQERESLDPLLAALEAGDAEVRRESLVAMSNILTDLFTPGPRGEPYGGEYPAPPGLENTRKGGKSLFSTPTLGPVIPRMIADVTKATRDGDVGVRRAAVHVLGQVAGHAAPADRRDTLLPAVLAAMKDADAEVRTGAAWVVGWLGSQAPAPGAGALDALTAAVEDENAEVRRAALLALDGFGPHARAATPAVIAALKDRDPTVRAAAAAALGALQAPMPEAPATTQSVFDDPH